MANVTKKTVLTTIDGTPKKRVFLSIISDYDLKTGVCELIDNALDVWRSSGAEANLEISVVLDVDRQFIRVKDNAGGVGEDDAELLIAPGASRNDAGQALIGVFGVGGKTDAAPDLADADRIFHILRAGRFRARFGPLPDAQKAELKDTIRWNTEAGERLTHADEDWVIGARSALVARVASFFKDVDLLIGPTTQVQPFDIETDWVREIEGRAMQTYIEWMQSCSWITVTCCPALSLPCGFAAGLPVGAQLIAPMRQDAFLLSAAKAVEVVAGSGDVVPDLD